MVRKYRKTDSVTNGLIHKRQTLMSSTLLGSRAAGAVKTSYHSLSCFPWPETGCVEPQLCLAISIHVARDVRFKRRCQIIGLLFSIYYYILCRCPLVVLVVRGYVVHLMTNIMHAGGLPFMLATRKSTCQRTTWEHLKLYRVQNPND